MARTWTVPATVVRVVDGDTVELMLDLGWRISLTANCRIIEINSPEINTAAGKRAKSYAEQLLPVGMQVVFYSQKLDKYGRPLGHLLTDTGDDFGELMLTGGHAIRLAY